MNRDTMKRPRTPRKITQLGDVRKDLTEAQLAGVGAVALVYNEAEALLDVLLAATLELNPSVLHEVTSRINDVDGKIEIVKSVFMAESAPKDAQVLLVGTLGGAGFLQLKGWRDAIIHARAFDATTSIALTSTRRGKGHEVLLTSKALDGVYERLNCIRFELREAINVWHYISLNKVTEQTRKTLTAVHPVSDVIAGRARSLTEANIQAAISRYREHQSRRLSLPPLPEFPEIPPELRA